MQAEEVPPAAVGPSLRGRIIAWTIGVFILTLAIFAAIWVAEVRAQVRELEGAQAEALLGHLAGMPELHADERTARERLAQLTPSLRRAGGAVRLAPLPDEGTKTPRAGALARWPLTIAGRPFELRYESDGRLLSSLTKRTAVMHTLQAVLAAAALLAGLWWILTRNLVVPLREICRALERMRRGNGWRFVVPQTDSELSPLVHAVAELGPGLEEQVYQWIGAERRAAVAIALSSIERSTTGPLERMRATVTESEAAAASPEERAWLRSIQSDLHRVCEALENGEQQQLVRADAPSRAWGRAARGARV